MNSDRATDTDDTTLLLQQKCPHPVTCSSLSPTLSLTYSPRKSLRKTNTYPRRKPSKNTRPRSSCKRKLKFNELSLSSSSSEVSMDLRADPFLEEIDTFLNNVRQNSIGLNDSIKMSNTSVSITPSKVFNSSTKSNYIREDVERATDDLQTLRLQRSNYCEDLENVSRNDYKYSQPANVPSLSSLWDKCSTDSYHTLTEKFKEEQLRRQVNKICSSIINYSEYL